MSLFDELEKLDNKRLGSEVAVMGRLEHVRLMIKWLRDHDISPAVIFDNDINKQGGYAEDVPIYAPGKYRPENADDISVIIYSPKYWEEMKDQLVSLGYSDQDQIFVLDRPSPEKNTELVIKGLSVYRRMQEKYGKDVLLFLANCPLGDYYLLGLYFKEYLNRNDISCYVMLGESGGINKLSEWFGIYPAETLSSEESSALIRAWMFLGDMIRLKPLTIWQGAFRHNPCVTRQKEGFCFTDTFRYMIYGHPEGVKPQFPKRNGRKEKTEDFFKEHSLKKNHTVLISPFSYSLPTLSDSFWNKLGEGLGRKGYSVAVNVGEEREENMIDCAVPVSLSFMDIMEFMEYAGTVIGMRSGFFDITSQAQCRRIILYPKKLGPVQWNSTDIDFCSLKSMELCFDAEEIEAGSEEETIDRILKTL